MVWIPLFWISCPVPYLRHRGWNRFYRKWSSGPGKSKREPFLAVWVCTCVNRSVGWCGGCDLAQLILEWGWKRAPFTEAGDRPCINPVRAMSCRFRYGPEPRNSVDMENELPRLASPQHPSRFINAPENQMNKCKLWINILTFFI